MSSRAETELSGCTTQQSDARKTRERNTVTTWQTCDQLARFLSVSITQNVTAAMLLEAPNEVRKKPNNQCLVFRTNPYGFVIEEALVQEATEGLNIKLS